MVLKDYIQLAMEPYPQRQKYNDDCGITSTEWFLEDLLESGQRQEPRGDVWPHADAHHPGLWVTTQYREVQARDLVLQRALAVSNLD